MVFTSSYCTVLIVKLIVIYSLLFFLQNKKSTFIIPQFE